MNYVKLGNTGLEVSKLCLGCMGFGEPGRGREAWSLNEEESRKIIKRALELGINFFDTANYYSLGSCEEILGRALKDFAKREDVVIASKLYFPMHEGPNSKGLSRKCIMSEIDKTLERLQTEYVDLYIIHRWDYTTPIEETMEALHDLVKMGKVRYIGASSMFAWQLANANAIAEKRGWTKFVSMQSLYNLLYREEEREMVGFCQEQKIAMTPWSPLAQGRLVRPLNSGNAGETGREETLSKVQPEVVLQTDDEVIKRVSEIAETKAISKAQVAMAWVLSKAYITSPLVGATKVAYLEDVVKALDITLTEEEITYLEEPYIPHQITGFK